MAPKAKKNPAKPAEEEPEAKKAKAEEESKKEESKEEEKPKFQEPDAPKDSRPVMKGQVGFDAAETTLNVIPTVGGKILTALTDAGMAYLLAGARANTAVKSGRYMFEAKVMQATGPQGTCQLRVGFSLGETPIVLGNISPGGVYFDSDGAFVAGSRRANPIKNSRFGKDNVIAVVLNLDSKSPNFNTIALYRDGLPVGDPQPLPDDLQGKPLYPHVCFRCATVHVNFGPTALKDLPFKCRMLQGAAASDVSVSSSTSPKDGKYEVMLPVAFPDEGTFDWLDDFLAKNPQYVELSDRKVVEWAKLSGLKGRWGGGSNDKPSVNFGIPELDNMSIRRVISAVAPAVPRNYLVMEVKSNLIAAERQHCLKNFNYSCYKKVAKVIMGEPSKEFKAVVQNKLLKEKQGKADIAWRQAKHAAAKKREAEKKRKEAEKQAKEVKKRAEAKKKAEEDKKKSEAKEGEEGKKEEDAKEDEKQEEPPAPMEEDAAEEKEEEEPEEETEPPAVELTDEEKAMKFMPVTKADVAPQVLNASFSRFTTPTGDEGFDDIQYEWLKGDKAAQYLKEWVLRKKLTSRVEDLKPGQFFREKTAEFNKLMQDWQNKLKTYQASSKKKPAATEEEGVAENDIFAVTDVNDMGEGVPLFECFTWEDWLLVQLRFELGLLTVSFKKDVDDEDRTGIPLEHFQFYYNKYYHKSLAHKVYGMENCNDVFAMVKDTVSMEDSVLSSSLSDELGDLDVFVKLTEAQRRERQRRIDAGDETARLKFQKPADPPKQVPPKPAADVEKVAATTVPAEGKPAGGKGKDFGKDFGKASGKDFGKDFGKGKDWGKDWGKNSKGYGKGKGKW